MTRRWTFGGALAAIAGAIASVNWAAVPESAVKIVAAAATFVGIVVAAAGEAIKPKHGGNGERPRDDR